MSEKYNNHLISESSPYLLQHAHNPVNWYPWGKEALEKAKKENKPMIISVGYAACHWCHVMEHESFEDESVAEIMNDHFVCIKVDREERPDIDQVYMTAAQLISGRGGWPLNAFALPDGQAFYAGSYFPKEQWVDLLDQIKVLWDSEAEKLKEQADAVTKGLRETEVVKPAEKENLYEQSMIDEAWEEWQKNIDLDRGGQKGAPKFPMPVNWEFLLAYHFYQKDENALLGVKTALDAMAKGGIYDHVGGGFARYSVDAGWHVPHFEKMLYDNAQLVSLYAHAWQVIEEDRYEELIAETLDFVQREMTSGEGGFYSSLDADSEGAEGKFYTWTENEMDELLGEDAPLIKEYFNVSKEGNWENSNVLYINRKNLWFLDKYKLNLRDLKIKIKNAKEKLLQVREQRERPALDDKILTSWNALMMKACIDAYRVFNKEEYLLAAVKNAKFIKEKMLRKDGGLFRNYKNGKASINAFLDDYALSVQAFIALYQATFDEHWLLLAKKLNEYVIKHFHDPESGMFYYTSDEDDELVVRKMELSDNVIPASNSVMAQNLYLLGELFGKEEDIRMSDKMLSNMVQEFQKNPAFYANWGSLMLKRLHPFHEVAIVGPKAPGKRREIDEYFLPNAIMLGGRQEGSLPLLKGKLQAGKTMIYDCVEKTCKMPIVDAGKVIDQLI
ncbi:MAG: thioredoxin domain-containing protein [Bacteroidota bacterium]|nr:thioredoxin domain-containing protein [Bacteroidota bacterium]